MVIFHSYVSLPEGTQTTKSEAPHRTSPLASFIFILSTLWRLSLLWHEGENQKIYMNIWEFERDQ